MRKASEEILKNFLVAGFNRGSYSWKTLQGKEPETLTDFYSQTEPYRLVEESIADLKKDADYEK